MVIELAVAARGSAPLDGEKHHNLVTNELFQQFKNRSINEVTAGACSSHPYPPAECVDVITGITQVFPQQLVATVAQLHNASFVTLLIRSDKPITPSSASFLL